MWYRLVPKAFKTVTLLDGLGMVEIGGVKKLQFKPFAGSQPKFVQHLCIWGKAGMIKTHKKTSPKIDDCGVTCMMVGCATKHKGDCYEMYDPTKGYVYKLRDVIWLKQMYYPKLLLVDDNDDMVPVLDNQDPGIAVQITAKSAVDQDNTNAKKDKDEVDVTSKGENDDEDTPLSEAPAPSVTQAGRVSLLPQ
eukprot:8949728-Ditylum_brightwellii.AAC.1